MLHKSSTIELYLWSYGSVWFFTVSSSSGKVVIVWAHACWEQLSHLCKALRSILSTAKHNSYNFKTSLSPHLSLSLSLISILWFVLGWPGFCWRKPDKAGECMDIQTVVRLWSQVSFSLLLGSGDIGDNIHCPSHTWGRHLSRSSLDSIHTFQGRGM